MEYCSTIPPYQQVADQGGASSSTPSVMVPVGVLKKPDASNSGEQSEPKNVSIFPEYVIKEMVEWPNFQNRLVVLDCFFSKGKLLQFC